MLVLLSSQDRLGFVRQDCGCTGVVRTSFGSAVGVAMTMVMCVLFRDSAHPLFLVGCS
jgi:hypothetical protein